MTLKLSPEDQRRLTRRTIDHYETRAQAFWEGTRDHDVSQNMDALLDHIPSDEPAHILDFGCGPGRDLVAFRDRGHLPVGLDGSAAFCDMARERSGRPVLHQDFLALDLPDGRFDGVFANASLFHVPMDAISRVLEELRASLKPESMTPPASFWPRDPRFPTRFAHSPLSWWTLPPAC